MARMLQVRNLPDEVHAAIKARAAAEHLSMSDFVAREMTRLVQYRSNAEILRAAAAIERRVSRADVVAGIRADRDR